MSKPIVQLLERGITICRYSEEDKLMLTKLMHTQAILFMSFDIQAFRGISRSPGRGVLTRMLSMN